MRTTEPAGFREPWDVTERLWGEIETLRHLAFAATRGSGGRFSAPWHSLDLPWDEMPDTPGVPRDRDALPSLDTALKLRRDRMATVREVIEGLTDEALRGETEPVEGPGGPRPAATRCVSACCAS